MSDLEATRKLLEDVNADIRAVGKLLTIAAAAERAGVRSKTVRRWYNAGRLPGIRSATGRIRIPERALHAFLDAR